MSSYEGALPMAQVILPEILRIDTRLLHSSSITGIKKA
jgi:hypothetical protein